MLYLPESPFAKRGIDDFFVNACRCFILVSLSDMSN
jgi:hypothetical protein